MSSFYLLALLAFALPIWSKLNNNLAAKFHEHMTKLSNCHCEPRPKIIPVKINISPQETFFPLQTIEYRCEGYCKDNSTCQSNGTTTEEERVIAIHNIMTKNQETTYMTLRVVNHTSCACVNKSSTPKRNESAKNVTVQREPYQKVKKLNNSYAIFIIGTLSFFIVCFLFLKNYPNMHFTLHEQMYVYN